MDFDCFLAHVVDHTVWWQVKCEWSFIHVSDEMQWVVVLFMEIDDEALKSDDLPLVIIWQTLC